MSKIDYERILSILNHGNDSFEELVKLSGLNPKTDFRGADLRNVDFGDCDLSSFDFTEADLRGADFSESRLTGAVFRNALFDENLILPLGNEHSPKKNLESALMALSKVNSPFSISEKEVIAHIDATNAPLVVESRSFISQNLLFYKLICDEKTMNRNNSIPMLVNSAGNTFEHRINGSFIRAFWHALSSQATSDAVFERATGWPCKQANYFAHRLNWDAPSSRFRVSDPSSILQRITKYKKNWRILLIIGGFSDFSGITEFIHQARNLPNLKIIFGSDDPTRVRTDLSYSVHDLAAVRLSKLKKTSMLKFLRQCEFVLSDYMSFSEHFFEAMIDYCQGQDAVARFLIEKFLHRFCKEDGSRRRIDKLEVATILYGKNMDDYISGQAALELSST